MKNTVYGYARVSTTKQNLDRQIDKIKRENPAAVIFQEKFTGTKADRPKWQQLLRVVKEGDTIIFDEVSRMSRDAQEGFKTYSELFNKGVQLVFLKEPHINTSVYKKAIETKIDRQGGKIDIIINAINEFMAEVQREQIEIAFQSAEKEVTFLHSRISEGVKRAQAAGKQIGRKDGSRIETKKSKEQKQVILKHSKDFGGSLSDTECMQLTGLARNTFYKYKRELKEGL